jgi:hypothetical protein
LRGLAHLILPTSLYARFGATYARFRSAETCA